MPAKKMAPELQKYVRFATNEVYKAKVRRVPVWLSLFAASSLALVLSLVFEPMRHSLVTLPLGVLSATFAVLTGATALKSASRGRDAAMIRQLKFEQAVSQVTKLEMENQLFHRIDPVAIELLESAARSWGRVREGLTGPEWGRADLPPYLSQLKDQAIRASDEGMRDLFVMASQCIGDPQRSRGDDVKGVVSRILEFNVPQTLDSLKELVSADWKAYAHQSPHGPAMARHGLVITDRLDKLARLVESKSGEIHLASATHGSFESLETLDSTLSEFESLKRAESEFDGQIHLGG
jgi:hypothetical protein